MDSTKRVFRFQKYGLKKAVLGFWSIILVINILTYVLMGYFNSNIRIGIFSSTNDLFSIVGANIMPIFIFFIVYGIVMYHEDFGLALSFGVTRRDFYKSVIVNNIFASLIFAAIQTILQVIDKNIMGLLGYEPMTDFGIFNSSTNNIFSIVLILFTLFLTFVSISNLFGVLQYRFGYKFWIGFGVTFVAVQILGNYFFKSIIGFSKIFALFRSIFHSSTILILEFFIIIICYIVGYFFIRKANIRK